MINLNKKSKKNFSSVSNEPDANLAGPYPTANSEEFVPKPLENIKDAPVSNSDELYDFIPKLKPDKYK